MIGLNQSLLQAHENDDVSLLAQLYAQAAKECEGETERAAFYLTQAYVFALEAGLSDAQNYYLKLKSWGREE